MEFGKPKRTMKKLEKKILKGIDKLQKKALKGKKLPRKMKILTTGLRALESPG
jgi:Txe/YoeB family toxin of Txe-Axe toxin-antitoxin module